MTNTIRSLVLSPTGKRVETALTWLLLIASGVGLLLLFTTSKTHMAPYVSVMAITSLGMANGFNVARHLATDREQRGRFPHKDAACAALAASIYPIVLLFTHLDGWPVRLAASPALLAMLYLLYALWPPANRECQE